MDKASTKLNLLAELTTSLLIFVQSMPVIIGVGIVAFSALGPEYLAAGMKAALTAGIFATVLSSVVGGTPFQWTGPRVSLAAVVGALAGELLVDPHLAEVIKGTAMSLEGAVAALLFLSVFMGGGFQLLFGALRLGTLIKFIPYPVIAGFMNGISIIILIGQLPRLVGLNKLQDIYTGLTEAAAMNPDWKPLMIAAVTVAVGAFLKQVSPKLPPPIVFLFVGTGVYQLASVLSDGAFLVPTLAVIPGGLPTPAPVLALAELLRQPGGAGLVASVVGTAMTLALIGSIQSLIAATVADSVSQTRHNSNRELIGQGLGNAVAAIFGGLPSGGSSSLVPAAYSAGSRGRLSRFLAGGLYLSVALGLGRAFAYIPVVVLAVILLRLAWTIFDKWSLQLIRRLVTGGEETKRADIIANLIIVFSVTALILTAGVVIAIGTGMGVALLLFMQRSGKGVIRRQYSGDKVHARVRRDPAAAELLEQHGAAIQVFEVQGPIFFGTSDELFHRVEAESGGARYVLLDLKRVSDVDSTGAMILARLQKVLATKGKELALTYLVEGQQTHRFLADMGLLGDETSGRLFDDTDAALAWAEDEILIGLQGVRATHGSIDLRAASVMKGMEQEHVMILLGDLLTEESYQKGDQIMAEGDPGDRLFFLMSGRVSVTRRLPDHELRLLSLRPGTVFGEMALLAGAPRSADVHAATEVKCLTLDEETFRALCEERPEIAISLLLNISRELSRRLFSMSRTVTEFEK